MRADGRGARALLGTAAVAALLAAVTGCGGGSGAGQGGDGPGQGAPAARSQVPPRAAAEASAPPGSGSADASGPHRPSRAGQPPEPATGSFGPRQRRYLEGRVPEGVDPAAVAVAGADICERIDRTARVDRAAAVDAIRSGEIAGAKAAVTYLCPDHKDLLRDAGR